MNNYEKMQEMAEWLRGLSNGTLNPAEECLEHAGDYLLEVGVCGPFYGKFNIQLRKLVDYKDFKFFSGNYAFPIQHPSIRSYTMAYCKSMEKSILWTHDEYGDRRRAFCKYCAEYIEARLKEWR